MIYEYFRATIENVCKTSYRSDDENSKLQSPKRSCGKRISYGRGESGRVFSVEGTWSMFKRRLM